MTRKRNLNEKQVFGLVTVTALIVAVLVTIALNISPKASTNTSSGPNVLVNVDGVVEFASTDQIKPNHQKLRIYRMNGGTLGNLITGSGVSYKEESAIYPSPNRVFGTAFAATRGNVYRVLFEDDTQPTVKCSYVDIGISPNYVQPIITFSSNPAIVDNNNKFALNPIHVPCPNPLPTPVVLPSAAPTADPHQTYTGRLVINNNTNAPFTLEEVPSVGTVPIDAPQAIKQQMRQYIDAATAAKAGRPLVTVHGVWNVINLTQEIFEADSATLASTQASATPSPGVTPTPNVTPTPGNGNGTPTPGTNPTPTPSGTPVSTTGLVPRPGTACLTNALDVAYLINDAAQMSDPGKQMDRKQFVYSFVQEAQNQYLPGIDQLAMVRFAQESPTDRQIRAKFTNDFASVTTAVKALQWQDQSAYVRKGVLDVSGYFADSRRSVNGEKMPGAVIILAPDSSVVTDPTFTLVQNDFNQNNIRYYVLSLGAGNPDLKKLAQMGGGTYTIVKSKDEAAKAADAIMQSLNSDTANCLSVKLASDKSTLKFGDTAQLTITYTNNTRTNITNAVFQQTLPTGLVTDSGASLVNITIGTLPTGQTGTAQATVKMRGNAIVSGTTR